MSKKLYCSHSPLDTFSVGIEIGKTVDAGTIIALVGSLGAGKTVLAKGIGKAIGVQEEITSPTFIIVSEYVGRIDFYHIDLYRINTVEEIEDLGIEEYLFGKGVTVIEWAEKAETVLPQNTMKITITVKSDWTRLIHVDSCTTVS